MRAAALIQAAGLAAVLIVAAPARAYQARPPQPPQPPQPAQAPEGARIEISPKFTSGSYLGIGVAEVTPERAKALNLREEHGVEVTRVEEDSPAAKGGMKSGDVVLEYNGQRVEGVEQFMRMVRETPAGREVRLSISRAGAPQQLTVRTGSRKTLAGGRGWNTIEIPRIEIPPIRIPDMPRAVMSWRSSSLGIEGEALTSQLAEYFGVKEGVLVRSVTKGSVADKAGLRAGDVIIRIDDTKVATPREITSALRGRRNATVTAVREKRETTFTVSVDETSADSVRAER